MASSCAQLVTHAPHSHRPGYSDEFHTFAHIPSHVAHNTLFFFFKKIQFLSYGELYSMEDNTC